MSVYKERVLPGTAMAFADSDAKGFSQIEMLISATGGLSLSQVCAITGLEGSTIQNWVKRGWVKNPKGKKYDEIQIARILIINALKDCVRLESIAQLMRYVNGTEEDRSEQIIRESELFDYLCDALRLLGNSDDFSRRGVETIVDEVIRDYMGPTATARVRLSNALAIMLYACVCSDVKRRTEAMLTEILPERGAAEPDEEAAAAELAALSGAGAARSVRVPRSSMMALETVTETVAEDMPASAASEDYTETVRETHVEEPETAVETAVETPAEKPAARPDVTEPPREPAAVAAVGKKDAGEVHQGARPWYFRKST